MQTTFTKKVEPFVLIRKRLRIKMSPQAYYLYAYFLEKPDKWVFHKVRTIKESGLKEKSYYKALKELVELGYVSRTQTRNKGAFSSTNFTIYDKPKVDKTATGVANHRVPENGTPQQGTLNDTDSDSEKEKIKNRKETSLRDNSNYPYGVTSLEDNMKLEDTMKMAKDKTQEAKDRKEKKQEQRASAFEKRKSNAVLLEEYFYSLLPEKVIPYARNTQEPESIYKFASDCKNVGLTELKDQKAVLKYFVDNWDFFCKMFTETRYCGMEPYPNLYNIVFCFYRAGLLTNGFGTHVSRNAFKKGDK